MEGTNLYTYKVKSVDRVIDGDTVELTISLGFDITIKKRVRVAGIDTPEKRTKDLAEKELGLKATAFAEQWFATNSHNLIVKTSIDGGAEKYGRLLGHFYCGDLCFNEAIVDAGLAWSYDGGTKVKDLSTLGT